MPTYNMATLNLTSYQIGYVLAGALAAYYLVAWLVVGRVRSRSSVMVRYVPPANLSPAAIRFLYTMRVDGRTYTAILAQLAARGLMEIIPEGRGIALKKTERDYRAARNLPAEEKAVFKDLFEWDEQVSLRRPDWRMLEKIQLALEEGPAAKLFTRHLAWVIAGIVLSGALAAWLSAVWLFGNRPGDSWAICALLGLTVSMYGAFGYQMWDSNLLAIRLAARGMYHRRTLPLLLAFVTIYPALWLLIWHGTPAFAALTEAMIVMNTFLSSCLRNHTAQGRSIRDEIEGFRQFLAGAEQDRLQRMNDRDKPARTGLEFIPYAIALDLREGWGDELGIRAMVETAL